MVNLKTTQGRHNFSKTERAAQKLGGRKLEIIWILTFLGRNFKENRWKSRKTGGAAAPPCHPPFDAPGLVVDIFTDKSRKSTGARTSYQKSRKTAPKKREMSVEMSI